MSKEELDSIGRHLKSADDFREAIYEIAFGDNALHKGYSDKEVIKRIREMSDSGVE